MPTKEPNKRVKKDFVEIVSNRVKMHPDRVAEVLTAFLDVLGDEIGAGHRIELRNFGVFRPVVRRERPGRNPKRPEITIPVPKRVSVVYKPGGKVLRQLQQIDPDTFPAK